MFNTIDNNIPAFLLSPQFRIHRHVVLQLMILLITINVFWDVPDQTITTSDRFIAWFFYHIGMCILIYLNIFVLAPRFLLKNKLLLYTLSVFITIVAVIMLIGTLQGLIDEGKNVKHVEQNQIVIGQVIFGLLSNLASIGFLVAGTSAILLVRNWMSYNMRINELESNTLQSELKHLKDQINPHFLFNMLNNANVLVKKSPDEASQVLFKLEDLLRYQINDSTKEKVQLTSEIHFLNDFLNLEKIRRDKFDYIISKEGDINSIELPPLLFIPFVENAVKHNLESENASYVRLTFKVHYNKLLFTCENSKPAIAIEKKEVGGLGLKNIRRRLELLFPDRHQLEIVENDTHFKVKLMIEL